MTRSEKTLHVREVSWFDRDAEALRAAMAAEVGPRYADRVSDAVRNGANAVDPESIHLTVVVYNGSDAVGHAALRWNGEDLELKRMFVRPDHRGSGVSSLLLRVVEDAAAQAGRPRLILQTGDRQPDAVRLYEKSGYTRIPIFPPYEQMPFSNCFEKLLPEFTSKKGHPDMTSVDDPTTALSQLITRKITSPGFGPAAVDLPPSAIRLLGGVPADEALPGAELARAYAHVLSDGARSIAALQYSSAQGIEPLRGWIAAHEGADASNVTVTNGALHGLSLVFAALLDPGDVVAVESPTFPMALHVLDHYGARVQPVRSTATGLDLDAFEQELRAGNIPKIFYVIPDFQNPTGTTLPVSDRARLVELAEKYGFVVLSDNPYRELRFRGEAVADLTLESDRVVRVNTFAKTLGPGLRTGWIVAAPWLTTALLRLRSNSDQHSSLVTQSALVELLDSPGVFAGIVERAQGIYRLRADALGAALTEELGDQVVVPAIEGGIFSWITFTDSALDLTQLRATANKLGVEFSLGQYFDPARSGLYANNIRIGFSNRTPEQLVLGASLIAQAVPARAPLH
ncbi:DNA-binding transcriptional MocR family regulator/GNAT superfamily N-acetyltransferase [Rhodococcus sp. 27YEA15]|uniref:aminotransferase class I/II-fold pyridoxal phosphate-dependent enzyme n=1 Tax=Rhodococcus sp. 27YEA15 TaxID=3156259 RepID=UPI003C7C8E8A